MPSVVDSKKKIESAAARCATCAASVATLRTRAKDATAAAEKARLLASSARTAHDLAAMEYADEPTAAHEKALTKAKARLERLEGELRTAERAAADAEAGVIAAERAATDASAELVAAKHGAKIAALQELASPERVRSVAGPAWSRITAALATIAEDVAAIDAAYLGANEAAAELRALGEVTPPLGAHHLVAPFLADLVRERPERARGLGEPIQSTLAPLNHAPSPEGQLLAQHFRPPAILTELRRALDASVGPIDFAGRECELAALALSERTTPDTARCAREGAASLRRANVPKPKPPAPSEPTSLMGRVRRAVTGNNAT